MSCSETAILLHGMLDNELDPATAVRIENHLEACPTCAAEYQRQKELRAAIRQTGVCYAAPETLRRRVDNAIPSSPRTARSPWWQRLFEDWRVGAGSSLALAGSLALFILTTGTDDNIQQELIAGHIRSLQADHLTDVATSDQHTVKPWFMGKVNVSPPVVDLAKRGFPLAGGRLDYIQGREAAVLVYRRRQHIINLFVSPSSDMGDTPPESSTHQGYNLLHWTRDGLGFWAVSELNRPELRQFADLYAVQTSQ
jgi:mycothiol system anti-sigma-R factor